MRNKLFHVIFVVILLSVFVGFLTACDGLIIDDVIDDILNETELEVALIDDFFDSITESNNYELTVEVDNEILYVYKVDSNKIYFTADTQNPEYYEIDIDNEIMYTYTQSDAVWAKDDGEPWLGEYEFLEACNEFFVAEHYEFSLEDHAFKLKEDDIEDFEDMDIVSMQLTIDGNDCEFTGEMVDCEEEVPFSIKFENVGSTVVQLPEISGYLVNYNYGEDSCNEVIVESDDYVEEVPTPTKSGYIFEGWYADTDYEEEFDFTAKPNGNVTLYAKWTPVTDQSPAPFPKVVDAIIDGTEGLLADLSEIDSEAYFATTLYIDATVGTLRESYDIEIKGNFSETLADNQGYIKVIDTVRQKTVLIIYVDEYSTVYVGEAFTNPSLNWFKLSQAESLGFVSDYFSMLPQLVHDFVTDSNLTDLQSDEDVSTIMAMVKVLGPTLFNYSYPVDFNYDAGQTDGDYNLDFKVEQMLTLLQNPSIASLMSEIDLEIVNTLNMVFPAIFGIAFVENYGSLMVVQVGVIPDISFDYRIEDGTLDKLGISYQRDADPEIEGDLPIDFKIGLKNIQISDSVTTSDLKPVEMPVLSSIDNGVTKLTFTIGIENKEGFEDIKIEFYELPDFTLGYGENGFVIENSRIKAYGVVTIDGVSEEISVMYDDALGVLVFDLAGLYELLDMDAPASGTLYYLQDFYLLDWLSSQISEMSEMPEDELPQDAQISDVILGLIVLAEMCLDGAYEQVSEQEVMIDILAVIQNLFMMDLYPQEYLPFSLEPFANALDMTVEELEEILVYSLGIEPGNQTVTEYFIENGLYLLLRGYFAASCNEDGAGISMTLLAGDDSIITLGCQVTMITQTEALAIIEQLDISDVDYETYGNDVSVSDNYDFLMEELMAMLINYMFLGNEQLVM